MASPVFWALIYASATFWSVPREHSADAFAAKATPARTIEQTVMVTLILFICAGLPE